MPRTVAGAHAAEQASPAPDTPAAYTTFPKAGRVAGATTTDETDTEDHRTDAGIIAELGRLNSTLSTLNPRFRALALDAVLFGELKKGLTELSDELDTINTRTARQSEKDRDELSDSIGDVTTDTTITGTFTLADLAGGLLSTNSLGIVSTTTIGASVIDPDTLDFAQFADTMTLDASTSIDFDTNGADLTFDAGTLHIDSANDRIGIGTTSPISKLAISGPGGAGTVLDAITVMSIGSGGSSMQFTNDNMGRGLRIGNQAHVNAGNYAYVSAAGGESFSLRLNAGINSSGNTGFLDLNRFGNSAAMVRMGTTTMERDLYVEGNVGIGTTSPVAKLHIGQSGSSYGLTIDNASQPRIDLNTTDATGADWNIVNEGNADRFSIRQTGGQAQFAIEGGAPAGTFRINSAGNIGIGTTTPSAKLHLYGSGSVTQRVESTDDLAGLIIQAGASDDSFIDMRDEFGNTHWRIGRDDSNSDAFTIANASSLNTSQRLTITTAGNVGIGTTSPRSLLDVSGGIATIQRGGSSHWVDLKDSSGTTQWYLSETSAGDLNFGESGVADGRLYLQAGGNVGIGTTSPAAKLTVSGAGNVALIGEGGTGNINTYFGNSIASDKAGVFRYDESNNRINLFVAGDSGSGVTIANGGNVGIGTTTPDAKLNVYNGNILVSGSSVPSLTLDSTGSSGTLSYNGSSQWMLNNANAGTDLIHFQSGGTDRVSITAAGNVGIGTTNPSEGKLHITGSAASASFDGLFIENTGSGGGESATIVLNPMFSTETSIAGVREGASGGDAGLAFSTSGGELLRMTSSGNVGIGTISPSEN